MARVRTAPAPQNIIIGVMFLIAAGVFALAPVPMIYRSLGVLVCGTLVYSYSGAFFAQMIVLVAPCLGLLSGDPDWLVMLPIILSSGILGMLALDFSWRYPAIVVAPVFYLVPTAFAWQLSQRRLFEVTLPWEPSPEVWVGAHGLTLFAGVLIAVFLDRRRGKAEEAQTQQKTQQKTPPRSR
ncbi:MAG: hypothetical protein U5L04_03135 [Trueperaceae bacterium]|nr:hypothetical protein [Trueperaceae bacterium]